MTISCTHSVTCGGVNDPAYPVSKDAWNAGHVITGAQDTSEKGQPNGYASLDGTGKVPSSQLPASSGGPEIKSGVESLAAGGSADVAFVTPFSSVPQVTVSAQFNNADVSSSYSAHTVTVNGFTLRGAGNPAGLVGWIATNAGNS